METIFSVIDVGTNSILLLIAERLQNSWKILHRDARTSSLGKGMKTAYLQMRESKKQKQFLKIYTNI